VKEYWLVSPEDKSVTVFLLNSEGLYDEGTKYEVVCGQMKAPVQTLKGLIIDLEELFDY
jgi:Uma2 family endonuclease